MVITKVQVEQGILQGNLEESKVGSYVSFKGIPYAKPPLDKLRFAAPQPPDPWQGIKKATQHGDNCLQKLFMEDGIGGSEDCLYLNIYTPNTQGRNGKMYPVMFFIHGGAFKSGSGDESLYGPEFLVNQDVVLVTNNYRMDVFGFLSVDTEDAPGNAGLKDQVAALKWVNANIFNFGGDPNNITIFGESSGSASVIYHLFSPLTKGLFQAAIAQSGVWTGQLERTVGNADRAFKLGSVLGMDTKNSHELIEFLKTIPATDLLNATLKIGGDHDNDIFFPPIIEKNNIPGSSYINIPISKLLTSGQFHDVPLIIGYTSGEGAYFLNETPETADVNPKNIDGYLSKISNAKISKEMGEKMWKFYFGNRPYSVQTIDNMIYLRSDVFMNQMVNNFSKEFASNATSPVYLYEFACYSELNFFGKIYGGENTKLTCHGDDLFYLFTSSEYNITDELDFSSESGKMVQKVLTLWTNFAKYKNPTPKIDDIIETKWEPIQRNNFFYLQIANKLELRKDLNKDRVDFLNELFQKHRM